MPTTDSDFLVSDELIKEIEAALEEYEKQLGFDASLNIKPPEYLYMPLEQLRKKDPESLTEAELEIARYGLQIQRVINRHKSWVNWGYSKLNELAAYNLPKVQGTYGYSQQELLAKNSGEAAKTLNKFIREAKLRLDRLTDTPKGIEDIANAIRGMKFVALKREGQHD